VCAEWLPYHGRQFVQLLFKFSPHALGGAASRRSGRSGMRDALLVIDVFNDFEHENGESLLASFREHVHKMAEAIAKARAANAPVVYVNDQHGRWDADAPGLIRTALGKPESGELLAPLVPRPDDRFLLKPHYSAFDHTPLVLLLRELAVERILLIGAATEGCIVQSGIDARELDFKVTILTDACATNDLALAHIALSYAKEVGGIYLSETRSAFRDGTE
jgi:nicotinamidase-related amidase